MTTPYRNIRTHPYSHINWCSDEQEASSCVLPLQLGNVMLNLAGKSVSGLQLRDI